MLVVLLLPVQWSMGGPNCCTEKNSGGFFACHSVDKLLLADSEYGSILAKTLHPKA